MPYVARNLHDISGVSCDFVEWNESDRRTVSKYHEKGATCSCHQICDTYQMKSATTAEAKYSISEETSIESHCDRILDGKRLLVHIVEHSPECTYSPKLRDYLQLCIYNAENLIKRVDATRDSIIYEMIEQKVWEISPKSHMNRAEILQKEEHTDRSSWLSQLRKWEVEAEDLATLLTCQVNAKSIILTLTSDKHHTLWHWMSFWYVCSLPGMPQLPCGTHVLFRVLE